MSETTLGLRTAIYKVGDIEAAKSWYTGAFGTAPYFDTPHYVGFNIAGYELGLLPDDRPAADKTDNVLSYWGVVDIEAAVSSFLAQGAQSHQKPTNVGGDIQVASVTDPWGNVIGLIYNPEFQAATS